MLLTKWCQGLILFLPAQLTPFPPGCQWQFKALALFCSRKVLLLLFFKRYSSSLIPALQVWRVGLELSVAETAGLSPSIILKTKKLQIQVSFFVSC